MLLVCRGGANRAFRIPQIRSPPPESPITPRGNPTRFRPLACLCTDEGCVELSREPRAPWRSTGSLRAGSEGGGRVSPRAGRLDLTRGGPRRHRRDGPNTQGGRASRTASSGASTDRDHSRDRVRHPAECYPSSHSSGRWSGTFEPAPVGGVEGEPHPRLNPDSAAWSLARETTSAILRRSLGASTSLEPSRWTPRPSGCARPDGGDRG